MLKNNKKRTSHFTGRLSLGQFLGAENNKGDKSN